jgi:hypothetical protein
MAKWMKEGSSKTRKDIGDGLEKFREALLMLFDGTGFGKLILQVAQGRLSSGAAAGAAKDSAHRSALPQFALRHERGAVIALHAVNLDRSFFGDQSGARAAGAAEASGQPFHCRRRHARTEFDFFHDHIAGAVIHRDPVGGRRAGACLRTVACRE